MLKNYNEKIKTRPELIADLERRRTGDRKERVVMCHGVFDLVHPGHIRHLTYAASKGDILIVTLTADKHIDKGVYRPHIPQDLRALNLAALEVVDYVCIDHNPTPLKNIEVLKPDFFAKGFEYQGSTSIKTYEETQAVKKYGGKMLFTPGDTVYSSTALLSESLPDLRYEKLRELMDSEGITFDLLRQILADIGSEGEAIMVIGDLIVDSYTYGSMIGASSKTPTLSVKKLNTEYFVGGAGIVAKHFAAAGVHTTFLTVVGGDKLSNFAVKDLDDAGVSVAYIVEQGRPTTHKDVITVDGHRLLKLDTVDNAPISEDTLGMLVENLGMTVKGSGVDTVVFSDFRHGIFNARTIPVLTSVVENDCMRVADSQVASRWGNILQFQGFELITPNEKEARFCLADQDSHIRHLASKLMDEAQCDRLALKLGGKGLLLCVDDNIFSIDSFADNVVDGVGAGDAFLAYMTACLPTTIEAAIIGTMAAAVACETEGNKPVTPEQVVKKLNQVQDCMRDLDDV